VDEFPGQTCKALIPLKPALSSALIMDISANLEDFSLQIGQAALRAQNIGYPNRPSLYPEEGGPQSASTESKSKWPKKR
jgi:hypothetical protein